MNKLLDKLEKASQPSPRQMGFVASNNDAVYPPLTLIIRMDASSRVSIKQVATHADSIILKVPETTEVDLISQKNSKLLDALPWGIQGAATRSDQAQKLAEAGCDFIVLRMDGTPVSILNEEKISKILSIDVDLEEPYLRVLEDVPTDTVLIEDEANPGLTIKDLMRYRSVISCVAKPVIVCINPRLRESELIALQNVGVIGVLADVKSAKDLKYLADLRKVINDLPSREESDNKRIESLVPQIDLGTSQPLSDPEDS